MTVPFFRAAPVALVWLFASLSLSAQTGWALDPHAGISAAFLQPAATAGVPYDWDVHLGAAAVGLSNNYAFLSNASGMGFLNNLRRREESDFENRESSFTVGGNQYSYGFPDGSRKPFARVEADLLGPSFSVQVGRFTRVGAFTRARVAGGFQNIAPRLNHTPYTETNNGVPIAVGAATTAAAAWGEVGLHLSHAFLAGADGELRFGVSPRYLLPVQGAAVRVPEGMQLEQVEGDSIILIATDAEIAITDNFFSSAAGREGGGSGFAVDLGVQYAWGDTEAKGYRYSVGVSLLDLGGLTFDRGARRIRFSNEGRVLLDGADYGFNNADSLDFAIERLSRDVNGTPDEAATIANSFRLNLPTAVSVQFAYRPLEAVQIAAAYRGGITNGGLTTGREALVTAQYSRWWYGGGLSVGVYDWREVNVGLQLRAGPLYLGTDRLFGTLLKSRRLDGGSFYFGLRITDFRPGSGKSGRGKRGGRKGGKSKLGCYQF